MMGSGSPHRGLCCCTTRSIPGRDGMEQVRAATSSPQGQRPPELMRGSQAGRMPCARRLSAQTKNSRYSAQTHQTQKPPGGEPGANARGNSLRVATWDRAAGACAGHGASRGSGFGERFSECPKSAPPTPGASDRFCVVRTGQAVWDRTRKKIPTGPVADCATQRCPTMCG